MIHSLVAWVASSYTFNPYRAIPAAALCIHLAFEHGAAGARRRIDPSEIYSMRGSPAPTPTLTIYRRHQAMVTPRPS